GAAVPPAYMLKTMIAEITLVLVVLNAIGIQPLYPLVVAAGGIAVQLGLLAFALADPRTRLTADYAQAALGPALSPDLVASACIAIAVAGLALAHLTRVARRTILEGVRLDVANAQLSRYFSPGIVAQITADAERRTGIGGRSQEVAVMFTDIRDFTSLTEALPPAEIMALLSDYQGRMVEQVFAFDGTIDKFTGDGIMVTFGTPEGRADDAERAVRAALAMDAALGALNAARAGRGQPPIRHGIGIHYGSVVAGNVGSPNRLEYTVIGDAVNVASRIQDACKSVGETLLISDAVAERLPPDLPTTALRAQQVKGRTAPVPLHILRDRAAP
ncbi:MAG: adenylate/guanylate cyclase domain-containing protein, partial [Pseudomonadota bacterium]